MTSSPYRSLPSVDALASAIRSPLPRALVVDAARIAIAQARDAMARSEDEVDAGRLASHIVASLERSAGTRVINATGVLLHTNLGRAPWSTRAVERATETATRYENLELDLETGERGSRGGYVGRLLVELTAAEAAIVVNNNAAGLLLALSSLAAGRAVPVSRGELIEIGGSYRLPEVIASSGARLVEVGTTNRTRLGDYRTALQTHDCAALLKVHPSNYRVEGFTEEAGLSALADLSEEWGIPLVFDVGSGLLDADFPWLPSWVRDEPAARQALEAGAGLVLFSGDKLLGGPQAGLIVGKAELVRRLRTSPLYRALRVDSVVYAAMAATLEAYLGDGAPDLPFWRMALLGLDELANRSDTLAGSTGGAVEQGLSAVGAGSAPGAGIPTHLVRFPDGERLHRCLLDADPPVLARRERGDLLVDLRAVDPEDDPLLVETIGRCR